MGNPSAKERAIPMCNLICTRRAKYIVGVNGLRCGLHAKKWLKESPQLVRKLEPTT